MAFCRPLGVSLFPLSVALALATSAGCSTVDQGLLSLMGPLDENPAVTVQPSIPPDVPAFTVEVREANESPAQQSVALDRVVHIQDALVKSGAIDKFRRMDVELYRPLPKGPYHRFEVRYDRKSQRVDPAFDYALQPADRLVITEDTSTIIDDMLGAFSDRLGLPGS